MTDRELRDHPLDPLDVRDQRVLVDHASAAQRGVALGQRLLDTGVSLQNIRKAVDHLRNRGIKDLANVTLFSDGATVYECTSAEEVVDLLAGGQGIFGIAVSGALRELSGERAELPAERLDGAPLVAADDELAMRRRRRAQPA